MTLGYEACAEGVRWCVSPGEWCGFPCMVDISYQICKVEMARAVYRYAFSCNTSCAIEEAVALDMSRSLKHPRAVIGGEAYV